MNVKKVIIVSVTVVSALTFNSVVASPSINYSHNTVVNTKKDIENVKEINNKKKYVEQECTITYYTASTEECGKGDGITASGKKAISGRTIACDHLPFGTRVEIEGHEYIVEDRFGGGYKDKIDIYTDSYNHAIQQGRKRVKVKIYKE